jgi:threonine dehydratase
MKQFEQYPQTNLKMLEDIYRASEAMAEPSSPVLKTELIHDDLLSDHLGAEVWLASELHQAIGAYKVRGAYNFVLGTTDEEKEKGVVASSAGNYGQGIALSSNSMGVKTRVFMPVDTPQFKVDRVAEFGGDQTDITLAGKDYDESQVLAKRFSDETGRVFASPFNDWRVIAGQGTWGVEITDSIPDIDMVFTPVGGMGLLAGVSTAVKYRQPQAEIVGVEPAGAASLKHALSYGKPMPLDKIDTFIDGAAVKQVGELPFKLAHHLVDSTIGITKAEIRNATTQLWERNNPIRAELAGALAVAGLMKYEGYLLGKTIVCLVSGGNLSQARYEAEVRSDDQLILT